MLDPSLPWLASGYRNFKEKDFHRPHSAIDSAAHRYLENGSNHRELRASTPTQYQHRRVKSATHARVHSATPTVKHRLSSRPRSARSTDNFRNEKVGCYNYSPENIRALARRPKSASAVLLRKHRPSTAQNKSVTQVERFHHTQEQLLRQYEKVTGEEVQHSCAFCPVECRPPSSSTNRPTSSTGLLAAHLPSHHDRRYNWTRPKTAPTTKREISSLPRYNNVQRGRVPYYTNFVSKLPLHLKDRTPSPPPHRRRQAFQDEAPPPVLDDDDEEEEVEEAEDDFLEEDINIEDDIAEPIVEKSPSPIPPPLMQEEELKMEPPSEAMQAWSPEITAPTPTPTASRRNSEQELPTVEKAPTPIPSPPPSPIPPPVREKPPSPPPPAKSPTPPPPPKSPTPPPKSPSPPPPQELSIKPPRECVHKAKPPLPPLPKVKKEVRIQEPPKDLPKEKVIVKKEKKPIEVVKVAEPPTPAPLKPSLKKAPSEPKIEEVTPPVKIEPPPLPTVEPEPVVEPPVEPSPNGETMVEEEPAPDQTESSPPTTQDAGAEKKKLGPPPAKVKVDVFSMDPQAMKQLLDLQMRAKRRGDQSDEDDKPPPGLASLLEPTNRMLKQSDWLRGRIALSRRAARFELPMDVGDLADMSPVDYLRRYCIISQRRRALYKKAFVRVDKDNDGKINRKELEKAVLDALVDTIQPDKVAIVLGYLGAEDNPVFTSRFFASFCALLERLYYREFTKDDIGDKKDTKEKEILENADFSGLDWKLDGQYVNPPLKSLLYML